MVKNFENFLKKNKIPPLKHSINSPIELNDFRFYLIMRLFATFSLYGLNLALSWQILELTKSPLALGFLGLAEFIPHLLSAFWGGHVTDRHYQKKILFLCLSSFCCLSTFLAIINIIGYPKSNPQMTLIFLYASGSILGIVRGFYSPAVTSYLALMLNKIHYAKSSAWNNVVWQAAAVGGPALGGFIYGSVGAFILHFLNSILLLVSILSLICTKFKGKLDKKESNVKFIQGILSGLKFIFSEKALSGALLLDLFGVLFGGAVSLLPIFADMILKVGPQGLGFLRAAPAVGSLLGSFILVRKPIQKNTGLFYLFAMSGFGLSMIGFALSTSFLLSFMFLLISGCFDSVSVVVRNTMIQILTPNRMRGKVGAINTIFIGSSNELGDFESGITAHYWGVVRSVWIGGLLTIFVALGMAKAFPELRQMEFYKFQISKNKKKK